MNNKYDERLFKAKEFTSELQKRNLVYQGTSEEVIQQLLAAGKKTYLGIDPTADFLHLGHYVGLSLLKRFIKNGFPVVILIGSLTARIGDPSFRSKLRSYNPNIAQNTQSLKIQLQNLFRDYLNHKDEYGNPLCEIIDNYALHTERFLTDATIQKDPLKAVLEFINEVCAPIKVVELANKKFLKDRLTHGLTLAEFLYSGLQGWDFLHLHLSKGVSIQIGGSDQWGNMLTGLHLIYKYFQKEESEDEEELTEDKVWDFSNAGVVTFPVVNDSNGNKFGKSEGNAICITGPDREKNLYAIRQYFLNATDDSIEDYLLKFTDLNISEIKKLVDQNIIEAKQKLANEVCKDIFGEKESQSSALVSKEIFKGLELAKTFQDLVCFAQYIPSTNTNWTDNLQLSSLFELLGLVKSKSEFNRLITSKGIYVSGATLEDLEKNNYRLKPEYVVWEDNSQEKGALLLRKGKKQHGLVFIKRIPDIVPE